MYVFVADLDQGESCTLRIERTHDTTEMKSGRNETGEMAIMTGTRIPLSSKDAGLWGVDTRLKNSAQNGPEKVALGTDRSDLNGT